MSQLFQELKRRSAFRTAIAYLAATWLILQVLDLILANFSAPTIAMRVFLIAAGIGFPVTLLLAWFFQITPEGIRLQRDQAPPQSHRSRRWLNVIIIAALSLTVVLLLLERRFLDHQPASVTDTSTTVVKSIAVLSFTDLSPNHDQEWFADGLAEEILNALTRTPDLLVASRTSSFAYKGTGKEAQTIPRELGVEHLLEGSVRRSGDRVRVTAKLVRADDGVHIWSENYDRTVTDVIDIQQDLALQIAQVMETTMDPVALRDMLQVGTRVVAAYRAYIHGVASRSRIFSENDIGDYRRAYAYFEDARQIDPGFSAAHRAAADFWRTQLTPAFGGYTELDASDPALSFANFHERIDRAIATATNTLSRRINEAEKAEVNLRLRRAVTLYQSYLEQRPGEWETWLSFLVAAEMASDVEASGMALTTLRSAGATSSMPASIYMIFAYQHVDPSVAADFGLAALERWPEHSDLLYQTHRTLLWAGRVDEAAKVLARFELAQPEDTMMIARQACAEGRRAIPLQILAERRAAGIIPGPVDWHILMMLGEAAAAEAVVRQYESDAVPNRAAAWLAYRIFDPAPFPSVMEILRRENVTRLPPGEIQ